MTRYRYVDIIRYNKARSVDVAATTVVPLLGSHDPCEGCTGIYGGVFRSRRHGMMRQDKTLIRYIP